jgi:peptidoglycan/LPS O-acetylase OafA/YrhL
MSEKPFRLGYVPALDGLRAVAILVLLLYHAGSSTYVLLLPGGFLGVDVFFTLSGFLITALLLQEWQDTGAVNLIHFYYRRALRLFPALTLLLLACLAFIALYPSQLALNTLNEMPYTIFFVQNWLLIFQPSPLDSGLLAHTWSLSVEEQFYLLWAPALALLLRCGWTPRGILILLAVLITVSAAEKVALQVWDWFPKRIYNSTDTRADALLLGAAAAVVLTGRPLRWSSRATRAIKAGSIVFWLALPALAWTMRFDPPALRLGGYTLFAIGVALSILHIVTHPQSLTARILSRPGLVGIGRVSYGIYLWHTFIFGIFFRTGIVPLPVQALVVLALLLSFTVPALSWQFVESPLLALRHRLSHGRRLTAALAQHPADT